MANTELKASIQEREIPKEENGGFESDDFCTPDDSDEDPTFDLVEETRSRLSKISFKKSRPRNVEKMDSESEEEGESFRVEIPELNEMDGKCFEKVKELIRDGHVEKLKLEQCKVYLRKYGLRLSGNKGILIERIKEHLEVINGGGQKKYPISSFVFNCKGDACTGDVVMFEQKVYEMFSIVSRSATGPPYGTRRVAGRIVKESYGAAKQQHTFTIEVLWSTGEKPLPPLHPLLIKGRNLYRLKTMRQRWTDEEERRKVLQEKHSRGFVARCSRETRIKEKETRKMGGTKRTERKSSKHAANPAQTKVVQQQDMLHQQQLQHQEKENNVILQQSNNYQLPVNPIETRVIQQQNVQHQQHQQQMATRVIQQHQQHHQQMVIPPQLQNYQHPVNAIQTAVRQQQNIQQKMQQLQHLQKENIPKPQDHIWTGYAKAMPAEQHNNKTAKVPKPHEYHGTHHLSQPHWSSLQKTHFNGNHPRYHQPHQRSHPHNFHHRQPLSSSNRWMWSPPRQQNQAQPRQWCRYYNEGNCYHGENCRYLHR